MLYTLTSVKVSGAPKSIAGFASVITFLILSKQLILSPSAILLASLNSIILQKRSKIYIIARNV